MKENSGKALQPIASGGAAMKNFSPSFLGPGSTERLLVCNSQWQWSVCTLNCFDWCCLPSVWKSFLCKRQRAARAFTAPATAVSEELTHTSMFAGGPESVQESSHSGKKHYPGGREDGFCQPYMVYGYKQTWVNKRQLWTHLCVGPQKSKNKNIFCFTAL